MRGDELQEEQSGVGVGGRPPEPGCEEGSILSWVCKQPVLGASELR